MQLKHHQKGLGLIGWIFMIPVILIGLVVLGVIYCELNKAYWDHKVKQWCEKDGGLTIYEKVNLTREEYEKNDGNHGLIHVASEKESPPNDEYAYKSFYKTLNGFSPKVWRSEYITYRKSDGKDLGKWVIYTRQGGDFPTGIGHPSSFSCTNIPGFESNPTGKIFSVEGF